jgi:ribokinase
VVVLGSFMMDLVVRAPRRPGPGETVIGTAFDMFLGGKGFNQAIAAARAGAATAMLGHLGSDDFADRFGAQLDADGIDTTHVHRHPDVGTGIGLPLVEDSGENSIVVIPRANHCLRPEHVEAAAETISAASVLLVQFEMPFDTVCAAAQLAHDAGLTVICNPAPARDDISDLDGLIDVIVPNENEAALLTGDPVGGRPPEELALQLRDRTGAVSLLTLGSAGALLVDGRGPLLLPAHAVPVVDTVGAGDAFCGALAAHLAAGMTLVDAARRANAAGALAVTRPGAEPSMPTRQEVDELLADAPAAAGSV